MAATIAPCTAAYEPASRFGGRAEGHRYTTSCGYSAFAAGDLEAAKAAHQAHTRIMPPPPEVLNRKPTPADVASYAAYFLVGCGYQIAYDTYCDHKYRLTDSCPCCP